MTLKVPLMTSAVQGPDSERKCGKFDLLTYIIINCTAGSRGTDMRGGKAHLGTQVRIMKRRVRKAAMPFLLSVLVLCLSIHCMLVQLLREKVAALVF